MRKAELSEAKKRDSVGLRQVAQQAGTSIATASAILSPTRSSTRYSAETRSRVLRVAEELQYQPNAIARALTGQPTRTLGVLFGLERASVAVANPFVFTLLQGIVAVAAEAGYNITLFTEPWHSATVSSGIVRDRRTDGVVVIAPALDSDVISYLADLEVPLVSIATPADEGLVLSVDVDNIAGAQLATKHLLTLGHKRIAHLTGDANLRSARERRDSFLQVMAQAGVPVPEEYVLPGVYTFQSGYERMQQLLALPQPPTAVFAASDDIARGAVKAATAQNVAVPDQISVVGFDNLLPHSTSEPFLTTVDQPLTRIGEEAARLLLQRLAQKDMPKKATLFSPTLIVRSSTAPPADKSVR